MPEARPPEVVDGEGHRGDGEHQRGAVECVLGTGRRDPRVERRAEAMNSLLRNWREAGWSIRSIYFLVAAEVAAVIAVGLWLGS